MSYTEKEFAKLSEKYGLYGSWAIWGDCKKTRSRKNPQCKESEKPDSCKKRMIDSLASLHSNFVFIGLNVSVDNNGQKKLWVNFRNGPWDYVLAQIEQIPALKGSYLTDLIKGHVEAKGHKILDDIKHGIIKKEDIDWNVNMLIDELKDVKFNVENGKLIILGKDAKKVFETEFYQFLKERLKISDRNIIFHRHYSQSQPANWFCVLLKKLDIEFAKK